MDKLEFILRQIRKTNGKAYENYVVTRIWHRLNNSDVKFITQQYVSKSDGGYALTDMYFPQLGLHIEVDELHHKKQVEADELREQDIINITDHQIERVDIAGGMEEIHARVEEIVEIIKIKVAQLGDDFESWDLAREYDPATYIEKGYIHLKDNVAFQKSVDACNCLGYEYKALYKGGAKHPIEANTLIWFPKLYPNGEWNNQISADESVITEQHVDPVRAIEHMDEHIESGVHRRIIFARVKGPLGDILYRFKGAFELDVMESRKRNCLVWRKQSDMIHTYKPVRHALSYVSL